MRASKRIAVTLLSAGLFAGAAPDMAWAESGKDWLGRPSQPCEPKCGWRSWFGVKSASGSDQQTQAAPGVSSPAAAPGANSPQTRARPAAMTTRSSRSSWRSKSRRPAALAARVAAPRKYGSKRAAVAPRSPAAEPWPAEAADIEALALMGLPASEQPSVEPRSDKRVASSFETMALVVIRRPAAFEGPAGGVAASTVEATKLGNLGPQLGKAGIHLSQAVFDQAQGLEQVATGEVSGLVVSRLEPRHALRVALARHPELMALPLGAPAATPSMAAADAMLAPPQAEAETATFQDVPAAPVEEATTPGPSRTATAFEGAAQTPEASDAAVR